MEVAATTVGTRGPETPAQNQQRLEAAKQALIAAKELGANVLVLPGGFFKTYDSQSRKNIADALKNEAKKLGIAVVFGIDEESIESSNVGAKAKKQQSSTGWSLLPMYAYAWSPIDYIEDPWQQRSIFAVKRQEPLISAYKQVRPIKIGEETLAVLLCGEIFNQHIQDALRNHKPRPKVVADLGHEGRWYRIWQGMKKLGLASMCSIHVQSRNAAKPLFRPKEGYMSVRGWDKEIDGPPRIEVKLLEF